MSATANMEAVILCSGDKILRSISHSEVEKMCEHITEFLNLYLDNSRSSCIGLLMNHNLYIPSIVMSLVRLGHAFYFINEDCSSLHELSIHWVLTFNPGLLKVHAKTSLLKDVELNICKVDQSGDHLTSYEEICYVIGTSGTTGENKLVRVQKHCIEDNVNSLRALFNITPNDTIYFGTPLTFDPSMIELFLSLKSGACLLIVPSEIKRNPNLLHQTLFSKEHRSISVLQTVPSLFSRWTETQITDILQNPSLRILAFGGESFPSTVLSHKRSCSLRIFNLYGITEVSCWASAYEIKCRDPQEVPIGNELGETIIEVRNDNGQQITHGEGEIYIGSNSRICLIDNENNLPMPVFRATGDLAKIEDKKIVYLNRKGDCIKRFGHKVNLKNIEDLTLHQTDLQNKFIWFKEESKLLCFLLIKTPVSSDMKRKIIDKVRVKLMHSLPRHCSPDFIDVVPKFPITSHGKINIKCLQDLYKQREKMSIQNSADLFKVLLCTYSGLSSAQLTEVLDRNFFDIGGNSIFAIQLLSEFSDDLQSEHPPELISILFEKSLKSCLDFLENFHVSRKKRLKIEASESPNDIKRSTSDLQLKIRWTYDLQACVDSSPVVFSHGNRLLTSVGSFSHIFSVVDASTGMEFAQFVLPDVIEAAACVSPCGNNLYVGCFDGKLYCLDLVQKVIRWCYQTGDRIKCTPSLCKNSEGLVFGSYDRSVHCVSVSDGQCLWKTDIFEGVVSRPLVNYERRQVFVATIFGTCLCLSEDDGKIVWTYKSSSPIFGAPCLRSDCIYWPNVKGKLLVLSFEGKEVTQIPCNGFIFSSLVCSENCIIFGCHDCNLYFVDAMNTCKVVFLNHPISSTPCPVEIGGETFVVAASNAGCISVVDFKERTVCCDIKLPGEIFSSPVVTGNKFFVGCRDNQLYCIEINKSGS